MVSPVAAVAAALLRVSGDVGALRALAPALRAAARQSSQLKVVRVESASNRGGVVFYAVSGGADEAREAVERRFSEFVHLRAALSRVPGGARALRAAPQATQRLNSTVIDL